MINKQKGADIAVARVTGKDVMDMSPYILRNNRLRSTSKFKTNVNNTLIVEPKTLPIK